MKIGIDFSPALDNKAGIGYYTSELASWLIKNSNHFYFLFVHSDKNLNFPVSVSNYKVIIVKSKHPNSLWMLKVRLRTLFFNLDRFLSTSNFLFGILFLKSFQIIHDIAPIIHPEFFPKKAPMKFSLLLNLLVKFNSKLLFISETTWREVSRHYNRKFPKRVIYGGVNSWVFDYQNNETQKDIRKKHSLPKKYILSISTLEPRKNFIRSIQAFSIFLQKFPDYKFLIGGKKGWFYEEIFEAVKALNLEDKVLFLGYVHDSELQTLYKDASFVMMLSIYEGLGLPILEAYALGKNVLVSDIPVFQELKNKNIFYTNQYDINSIAKSMVDIATIKPSEVDERLLNKYSWQSTSERVLNFMAND